MEDVKLSGFEVPPPIFAITAGMAVISFFCSHLAGLQGLNLAVSGNEFLWVPPMFPDPLAPFSSDPSL